MCGVNAAGGGAAVQMMVPPTKVLGANGDGLTVQALPSKFPSQSLGGGGSAAAGTDALRPVLEQLTQAIQSLLALTGGVLGGGATPGAGAGAINPRPSITPTGQLEQRQLSDGSHYYNRAGNEITAFQYVYATAGTSTPPLARLIEAFRGDMQRYGSFNPADAQMLSSAGASDETIRQLIGQG